MHVSALLSSQLVSQLENKTFSVITKIVTKNQDRNLDILAKNKVFGGTEPKRLSEWDQSPLKNQLYWRRDNISGWLIKKQGSDIWEPGDGQMAKLSNLGVEECQNQRGLRNRRWFNAIIFTRSNKTMFSFGDLHKAFTRILTNSSFDNELIMPQGPE